METAKFPVFFKNFNQLMKNTLIIINNFQSKEVVRSL